MEELDISVFDLVLITYPSLLVGISEVAVL